MTGLQGGPKFSNRSLYNPLCLKRLRPGPPSSRRNPGHMNVIQQPAIYCDFRGIRLTSGLLFQKNILAALQRCEVSTRSIISPGCLPCEYDVAKTLDELEDVLSCTPQTA